MTSPRTGSGRPVTPAAAWTAQQLGGLAAIIGSYLAGLFLGRTAAGGGVRERQPWLSDGFSVPIFFLAVGLHADLSGLAGPPAIALGVTAVAVAAKVVGCLMRAMAFPVGFVLLVLLGLELTTGNFALWPWQTDAFPLPPRPATGPGLMPATCWAASSTLPCSYLAISDLGLTDGDPVGEQLRRLALAETIAYTDEGARGWALALVKGVLANWMVTVGAVMAFVSRSVGGKMLAMWLPIVTFFALGYEHSIVNMFVVPAGMLLGADISLADWWLWSHVPVTLGNVLDDAPLRGLALYGAHRPGRPPGAGT